MKEEEPWIMMDKINEVLKANGKRELSMDELDKVSGGTTVTGNYVDEETMYDLYMALTRLYGYDTAHQMFMAQTGYVTYEHCPPCDGTDEEKMGVVLCNYWKMVERKNGYH